MLRRKSTQTLSKKKAKLWKVFSAYIRARDKNICFICGREAFGKGYHAGHFIPKSVGGITLYFHENNVHGCCYHCNINLGGNLYEYGVKLGKIQVKALYALKNAYFKPTADWYDERTIYYTELLKSLYANS